MTIEANWWGILLARLFGRKIVSKDGGTEITMYNWRGINYVTKEKKHE